MYMLSNVSIEKDLNIILSKKDSSDIKRAILTELDNNIDEYNFIKKYFNIDSTHILSTSHLFNIQKLKNSNVSEIINLRTTNLIHELDKFLNTINYKLPYSGIYIGRVETYKIKKKKIYLKYPLIINSIVYFFYFFYNRIISKIKPTKSIYNFLNKNKTKSISRAEILGRLIASGFEIIEEVSFRNYLYFVVKKVKNPLKNINPTNGVFISLNRVGRNGKIFKAYKIRTMHPYSEFLQSYVYKKNNLDKSGKIKNDFRISRISRFLRKYWIDEIPMIINLLKGDIKLVGVRPISKHFFSLYDKKLQKLRNNNTPGFIPPYYADLPKNMDEIIKSELKYLMEYEKNPIRTDLKYLLLSLKNVFFHGVRSK